MMMQRIGNADLIEEFHLVPDQATECASWPASHDIQALQRSSEGKPNVRRTTETIGCT